MACAALTCSTLFGLIAVTGLQNQRGALGLDAADVDLHDGVLHNPSRQARQGAACCRSSASVTERLRSYASERDRLLGHTPEPFFVTCGGDRLGDCGARYNFAPSAKPIGLRHPPAVMAATGGDRASTICAIPSRRERMIDWYRTGQGPGARDDQADDLSGPCQP